jgi:predicted GNAT superfamily acetyltransferase
LEIAIKDLQTNEEYFEIIELQKIIWRLHNYNDCIPNHIYMAVSEIGGVVLGAFADKKMVGFLMALIGCTKEKGLHHHSHILGVHPEYACHHIGFRLKKAHYDRAKPKGIKLVTWTYDPLQGPNATLNITKLGAIVQTYKVNYYGEVMGESDLVSGIASDRFWVEWYIQTNHAENHINASHIRQENFTEYSIINDVEKDTSTFKKMVRFHKPSSDKIAIEIPIDFQTIFDLNKKLAIDWRFKTREIFLECFQSGYSVTGFTHNMNGNYYLLQKNFDIK